MLAHLTTTLKHPRLLRSYRQVFLLSHMRANTSLLGHILGASAEVEGYYEMHIGYYSWKSRWRQKLLYFAEHEPKPEGRYLFDKVLHNEHAVDPGFLCRPDNRILFSLRPPELTVPSIVTLYRRIQPEHEYCDPGEAFDYYCARLEGLERLSSECAGRFGYLEAQALREDSERVLGQLSGWLELRYPLSANYDLQPKTGERRAGDHSENLKQGKIVSSQTDYSHIELDAGRLAKAQELYQRTRDTLLERSAVLIG